MPAKVSGPPYVFPPEYYQAGEAMPPLAETLSHYSPGMQENEIARLRAMMAQQKSIAPALKYFVTYGYRASNKLLKQQPLRKPEAKKASEAMEQIDAALLSEFCKRERPLTVYRGITPEFASELEKLFNADGLFTDPGYIIAATVERQVPNMLQIEIPAGAPVMGLDKFLPDSVLLPHGSRFKTTAYLEQPRGRVRVVAHWLGS